jgi:two-component system phosphate regulon sensor histidine kinase PhoR
MVLWFAILFVAVMALFGAVVTAWVRSVEEAASVERLAAVAGLIEASLDPAAPIDQQVVEIAQSVDFRITVVAPDGTVLGDSADDPADLDNHLDRPEIRQALGGEVGVSRRLSASTADDRLYVAVPPETSGLVVRLSMTEPQLADSIGEVTRPVWSVAVVLGALGLVVVGLVAHRLASPIRELTDMADEVAAGTLDVAPRRSSVAEFDRLGMAIGRIASQLGRRIAQTDEERRTLGVVLGALPQGVILFDEGRAIYANPAASALVGIVPDRLAGLVPRGLARAVQDAAATRRVVELEVEHGAPPRRVAALAVAFEGESRVLLVLSDVTERRRLEAMRRDFVADASHELKTPVGSILASIEALALALDRDPDRARAFAGRVEASARQLARLIADLLDLSRVEASQAAMEPVALDELVETEVAGFVRRAGDAGIELTVDTTPVVVRGSAADLALAIRNLCDNACRYTDSGGRVAVKVERAEDRVRLTVSDTGAGIPQRALDRVFERFYRVDVARSRATGGTGLGLAIVKHVTERHGGLVSVESQLGSGSTFTMELPVVASTPAPV